MAENPSAPQSDLSTSYRNRCIVTIGASAGGVEVLQRIVSDLPPDLPATVFVVLHVGTTSYLSTILERVSALQVSKPRSGMPFEQGHIYVAPPGFHLLIHDDHMLLRRGPRENLARPAIDPLFRSAACSFGAHVIGVLLSGSLSDGTAGLRAIKSVGGLAVIQHPKDAAVPSMVQNALRYVDIDHCVPAAEIGPLVSKLAAESAGKSHPASARVRLEAAVAAQEHSTMKTESKLGELSAFICPECHGPLWEIEDGEMLRYRCHTGHAFTADAMLEAQSNEADEILWSLLRAHQQRAQFARRMADHEKNKDRSALSKQLEERALDYQSDVEVLERLLERGWGTTPNHEPREE